MILLDTESGDPDDIMVIPYLADKGLAAVTINPGTPEQVGLIKAVLKECGLDIPVGGTDKKREKSSVSAFYDKIYDFKAEKFDALNSEIADEFLGKGATLLTCGLPKNYKNRQLGSWWAQGGFAGDSVMGDRPKLEKFEGLECIQSFNFSDRRTIQNCMENSKERHFVSKNICHGVIYDRTRSSKNHVIKRIMDIYLKKHKGKAFHDLLAAWAMLNPDGIEWEEVDVYYEQNRVGSRLQKGTNTFISVGYDAERFWNTI